MNARFRLWNKTKNEYELGTNDALAKAKDIVEYHKLLDTLNLVEEGSLAMRDSKERELFVGDIIKIPELWNKELFVIGVILEGKSKYYVKQLSEESGTNHYDENYKEELKKELNLTDLEVNSPDLRIYEFYENRFRILDWDNIEYCGNIHYWEKNNKI